MFYSLIVRGRKGLGIFWEKEWGTITSKSYDIHILLEIQAFIQTNLGLIFI